MLCHKSPIPQCEHAWYPAWSGVLFACHTRVKKVRCTSSFRSYRTPWSCLALEPTRWPGQARVMITGSALRRQTKKDAWHELRVFDGLKTTYHQTEFCWTHASLNLNMSIEYRKHWLLVEIHDPKIWAYPTQKAWQHFRSVICLFYCAHFGCSVGWNLLYLLCACIKFDFLSSNIF